MCVAPSNKDIVWVGTGESNPRNSVSYGDGVYKSTDGGKTWKNMGLKKSFQIGRILIHPKNPDIVYVGALGRLYGPNEERGLFKTIDGGKTWEKVLYIDDKTGVIDLRMHPADPETLLAATYERQRDGYDSNDPAKKIAAGSGLYRSTDGGKTWKKITKGLPTCKLGRIGIDWYRKDPRLVYLLVESEKIGGSSRPVAGAPFLGLQGEDGKKGARVTQVSRNGPADRAGLKIDDVIVRSRRGNDRLLCRVAGGDRAPQERRQGEGARASRQGVQGGRSQPRAARQCVGKRTRLFSIVSAVRRRTFRTSRNRTASSTAAFTNRPTAANRGRASTVSILGPCISARFASIRKTSSYVYVLGIALLSFARRRQNVRSAKAAAASTAIIMRCGSIRAMAGT